MSSVQPRTLERLPSSQEAAAGVIELQPRLSAADFDIDFNETREHEKWTETKIMSHALTHDAYILGQYLEVEAKLVPDPILRIRGTHKGQYMEDGYGRYGTQVDFDLVISLRDQVAHRAQFKIVGNSRKAYRGTRTKTNALSRDPEACLPVPSLDDWCRDFCAYSKGPKR